MPETQTQHIKADTLFFEEVQRQKTLQEALARYGFTRQEAGPRQHNSVLIITKEEWTLPRIEGQTKSLNVHFEARTRNGFRLEIGLDPYEGKVEHKPDLLQKIQPILAEKTRLLRKLRDLISNASSLPAHIQTSEKYLFAPEAIKSHTILKFIGNLPVDPSRVEAAKFFAEVIDAIAPMVDDNLADNTKP